MVGGLRVARHGDRVLTRLLTRLRRTDTASDAGMTLVELLVGMTILSIAADLSMGFFVGTSQQNQRSVDSSVTVANARVAVEAVSSTVQFADTPTNQAGYATARFPNMPTATSLTFYANLTGNRSGSASRTAPSKVSFTVTNGQLVEQVYAPLNANPTDYTQNYSSTPTTQRDLLDGITNTTVFTYCTDRTDPATTCTTATTTDSIAAVGVSILVPSVRTGDQSTTLQSMTAITGAVAPGALS